MNKWGELDSRGRFHGKATDFGGMVDVEGNTLALLPPQRIHQGITSQAANEVIRKRVTVGLRFIIKRREGRNKQIEEWTVTSVTDCDIYCLRHVKSRKDGVDKTLYSGIAVMSYKKLREGMKKGRIKTVKYPQASEYATDALIDVLVTEASEKQRKAKHAKTKSGFEGWRPMRLVSRATRRHRAGLPKRIHVKKHELYDPYFGRASAKAV